MGTIKSKTIKRTGKYYVYIVRCKDGTFYAGYTNDVDRRLKLHNCGKGAKYTRGRGPVELVYSKGYKYYKRALRAEREIKSYTRKEKEELINGYEESKKK